MKWPVREQAGVLRLGPAGKLATSGAVERLSLDQHGRTLAGAGSDRGWIFDVTDPTSKVRHVTHASAVFVATSPDGTWMATGTRNGHGVKIWETLTGRLLVHLIPNERSATVLFSPDG